MGSKDVEVDIREKDGGRYIFLLNHSDKEESIKLSFPGEVEEITLKPREVRIIKR